MRWWWQEEEGTYVRDIQVLAPEKPLPLPPIRPLTAQSQPRDTKTADPVEKTT